MMKQKILVTGGAGYVGAVLVPKLLALGHRVRVIDLYLYGDHVFDAVKNNSNLEQVRGDIRAQALLREAVAGCDAVIHLACIANDPSYELDPALGRSINFDAFEPLVRLSKDAGVKRFIYASSSSVYGVSDEPSVTEDHPLKPMTDYSKYKALCESILPKYQSPDFTTVTIRPATVCGYSPRQRLDLIVNIFVNHAFHLKRINILGGSQLRPNIHIEDIADLYTMLLELPSKRIEGKIFNAGIENRTVTQLATLVRDIAQRELNLRDPVELVVQPTNDNRSYHISSEKIERELNFVPRRTIEDAATDLLKALRDGRIPDALTDDRYYNVKTMQKFKSESYVGQAARG